MAVDGLDQVVCSVVIEPRGLRVCAQSLLGIVTGVTNSGFVEASGDFRLVAEGVVGEFGREPLSVCDRHHLVKQVVGVTRGARIRAIGVSDASREHIAARAVGVGGLHATARTAEADGETPASARDQQ